MTTRTQRVVVEHFGGPEVLRVVQQSSLGRTLGRERMFFNLQSAVQHYEQIAATTGSAASVATP